MGLSILKRNGEYVRFTAKSIRVNGKPEVLLTCENCAWKTFSNDKMAEHECKQKRKNEVVETYTDCRSETGITVGLIDAIITMVRLLAERDLSDPEIQEALKDLRSDEDLANLLRKYSSEDYHEPFNHLHG